MDALKQKAESLQSIIFENSPNAICILDEEQRIKEVNPSFHNIFNEQRIKLVNWPVYAIMNDDIFRELAESEEVRISRKVYMEMVDRYFYCNIVKLDDGALYVGIFTDITRGRKESNRTGQGKGRDRFSLSGCYRKTNACGAGNRQSSRGDNGRNQDWPQ